MSEGGEPPPLDQRKRGRGRSGIARSVVRRDIFDNLTVPVALTPAAGPRIRIMHAETGGEDVHRAAEADFAATVAESTAGAEGAKRPRPDSSPESMEGEDKRPKTEVSTASPPYGSPQDSASSSRAASPTTGEASEKGRPKELPPPRSPSPMEGGSQDTWPRDSTSYAALPSTVEERTASRPTSPQPGPSGVTYAAAAAAPASPRSRAPAPVPAPRATPRSSYPPITAERLPNWTRHFEVLKNKLGHAPNARPLGKGVRFLPGSAEEFRVIQRHLTEAMNQDKTISWFCYSPAAELPTKVAIRGLPLDTPPEEVIAALRSLGFPAQSAKAIPGGRGRHGCTYFVQLVHLKEQELRSLYKTTELLCMPGLLIEAWRGATSPPQCHRCQAFGHSSANCHRQQKCVHCAGEHLARDCPRPLSEPPTCANCAKAHTAKDRRCPVFKKEARRRGINVPAPHPNGPRAQPKGDRERVPPVAPKQVVGRPIVAEPKATIVVDQRTKQPPPAKKATEVRAKLAPPTTLAPPANQPTARDQPIKVPSRKKRRKRAARPPRTEPAAASTPQPRKAATEPKSAPAAATRPVVRQEVPPPVQMTTSASAKGLDTTIIVRVFMEALTAILVAYTQGQDIIPAISAGIAALAKLNSS
ncbi:uncharacterized protein LOC126779415 [Nymphalis io]|uniref:uncharacterized protein LOC126779415 n=1 Tax=Inachis io TaxID=171585 RepID=UPI00216A69D2|nr:uncharacterized protein LOC126779415 [Nymphalis io]